MTHTTHQTRSTRRTLALCAGLTAALISAEAFGQNEQESTPAACRDGLDNDGDGLTDCADSGCGELVWCRMGTPETYGSPLDLFARIHGPRAASYGTGLAVSGLVAAPLGIALMTAAVVLGFNWDGQDDAAFLTTTVMPLGAAGFAMAQVGNGLTLGGLLRVIRTARTNGVRGPVGPYAVGWVLWGLSLACAPVLSSLESFDNLLDGPFFVAPLAIAAVTLLTVGGGWSAGRSRVRREVAARSQRSASIVPVVSPGLHGTTVGIAGRF